MCNSDDMYGALVRLVNDQVGKSTQLHVPGAPRIFGPALRSLDNLYRCRPDFVSEAFSKLRIDSLIPFEGRFKFTKTRADATQRFRAVPSLGLPNRASASLSGMPFTRPCFMSSTRASISSVHSFSSRLFQSFAARSARSASGNLRASLNNLFAFAVMTLIPSYACNNITSGFSSISANFRQNRAAAAPSITR
jgi:hypothetical protein